MAVAHVWKAGSAGHSAQTPPISVLSSRSMPADTSLEAPSPSHASAEAPFPIRGVGQTQRRPSGAPVTASTRKASRCRLRRAVSGSADRGMVERRPFGLDGGTPILEGGAGSVRRGLAPAFSATADSPAPRMPGFVLSERKGHRALRHGGSGTGRCLIFLRPIARTGKFGGMQRGRIGGVGWIWHLSCPAWPSRLPAARRRGPWPC